MSPPITRVMYIVGDVSFHLKKRKRGEERMEFSMIQNYRENDLFRSSFNELAGLIFGIDFEKWYRLGFWSDRYRCYSFIDQGKVVANVSANIIELIIKGDRVPAIQIGTVMTHPDYRKRGLADKLMKVVLEEYKNHSGLIFLFGNMEAEGFYRRFEFDTVNETCFHADISHIKGWGGETEAAAIPGMTDVRAGICKVRNLNVSNEKDVEIIRRLGAVRVHLSNTFGVAHAEGILAWHCLNVFPEELYYIESLDTLVIYKSEGGTLHLYDVICSKKPAYRQIFETLDLKGAREVIFHFTPESDDFIIKSRPYKSDDYIFFVMSDSIQLEGEFFYPDTAHA